MDNSIFINSNSNLCVKTINEINTMELLSKIETWKDVDLRTISDLDLSNKLLQTIPILYVSTTALTVKNILHRVRHINEYEKLNNKNDIWYPPKKLIKKMGRINNIGESMLYCSLNNMVTPILECSIKPGDWYAFMQYKIKKGSVINVTNITSEAIPSGLTEMGILNIKIIKQFLYNEFTKQVGLGTEFLYRASYFISRDFMDTPDCGGFLYPSIASYRKSYNVALKPNYVDKNVELDCLLICQMLSGYNEKTDSYDFKVIHKAKLNSSGKLEYLF